MLPVLFGQPGDRSAQAQVGPLRVGVTQVVRGLLGLEVVPLLGQLHDRLEGREELCQSVGCV